MKDELHWARLDGFLLAVQEMKLPDAKRVIRESGFTPEELKKSGLGKKLDWVIDLAFELPVKGE